METIGLFPLNVVLFPESTIPLHIFEERYRKLINKVLDEKSVFGINLSNPKIQTVGCSAEISKLSRRYKNGRMDILATGVSRYRLKNFSEGEDMYFIGEIEYFMDEEVEVDKVLLTECIDRFNEIISTIKEVQFKQIDVSELETDMPSFLIAQKSGLSLSQRQNLLGLTSENKRLEMMNEHLSKVLPMIDKAGRVNNIVKNDGYIKLSL